jgi:hypothetical protein
MARLEWDKPMYQPESLSENEKKALTSIHLAYTLPGTRDQEGSEEDQLIVKYFLEILAEVASSVATRRENAKQNGNKEPNP